MNDEVTAKRKVWGAVTSCEVRNNNTANEDVLDRPTLDSLQGQNDYKDKHRQANTVTYTDR